jgi:hypothetical protein
VCVCVYVYMCLYTHVYMIQAELPTVEMTVATHNIVHVPEDLEYWGETHSYSMYTYERFMQVYEENIVMLCTERIRNVVYVCILVRLGVVNFVLTLQSLCLNSYNDCNLYIRLATLHIREKQGETWRKYHQGLHTLSRRPLL